MGVRNGRRQPQTQQDGLLRYRLSLAEVLLASLKGGKAGAEEGRERNLEGTQLVGRNAQAERARACASRGFRASFPLHSSLCSPAN